ncbi:MAG: VCBS domain-containing protein, partial [Prosthecochloris sp.]|nr:VCBS domain-containing protein [Prosthecochloris sp.]
MRLLQQGDSVYEGEAVVTADGVRVDLQLPDGTLYPVQGPLLAELDVPEDVPQRSADEAPEKVEVAESQTQLVNAPPGVGAPDDPAGPLSRTSSSSDDSYSDDPSGYLRVLKNQDIEEIQLVEGGNSFAAAPILSVSIVGGYNEGTGGRAGGYDSFLDGRATYNPRLIEGTDLLRADSDAFDADLRTFDGSGDDDEYVNRLPKPLPDVAEVVEGGNTVSGNVLDNDADGNGRSTVISVTYVPEPQVGEDPGDPVTEDVPAGRSVTVDSLYGTLTIYSDGRWEYLSDPYEAHDAPPSDAPLQDLFTYEVKDVDGDRASSTLTIDVLDTEPLIDDDRVPRVDDAANPAVVDEDDLDPDGTDLNSDGKQPSYSGDLGVEKAADPIDTVFIEQIAPSGLASEGKDVSYYISEDGHTLYAYTGDNEDSQTPPIEEQLVFRVEISNPESSSAEYTFTLLEQIDHEDNKGENFIDLTFDYKVVDKANNDPQGELEGDTAENRFTVRVVDDVPELARDEDNNLVTVNGLVHEDALDNDFSTGNGESDADPQQTVSAGGGASGSGGSLSSLFREGADRPVVYSITKDTDKLSDASSGLKSKGEEVTYAVEDLRDSDDNVIGQRLTGYVDNSDDGYDGKPSDESEDRVVFTLEVEASSGDWSFELNDQLDHEAGSGDSGVTLVNGNGALDFTGLIEVTDHDADTVNLGDLAASSVGAGEEAPSLFTVTVENDVPELARDANGNLATVSGLVHEDALDNAFGTGNGESDADPEQTVTVGSSGAGSEGSLSSLINKGADEEVSYSITKDTGKLSDASSGLKSKGEEVTY